MDCHGLLSRQRKAADGTVALIAPRHLAIWASLQAVRCDHPWCLHWESKTCWQNGRVRHDSPDRLAYHRAVDHHEEGKAAC